MQYSFGQRAFLKCDFLREEILLFAQVPGSSEIFEAHFRTPLRGRMRSARLFCRLMLRIRRSWTSWPHLS
jgi:hypothetical protein